METNTSYFDREKFNKVYNKINKLGYLDYLTMGTNENPSIMLDIISFRGELHPFFIRVARLDNKATLEASVYPMNADDLRAIILSIKMDDVIPYKSLVIDRDIENNMSNYFPNFGYVKWQNQISQLKLSKGVHIFMYDPKNALTIFRYLSSAGIEVESMHSMTRESYLTEFHAPKNIEVEPYSVRANNFKQKIKTLINKIKQVQQEFPEMLNNLEWKELEDAVNLEKLN